jgi:hypothetical protein
MMVVGATLLLTRIAFACPSCPTTNTVRWIVLGDGFWFNALVAVLPFIVVGAVSYFAHGIGRVRGGERNAVGRASSTTSRLRTNEDAHG